MLVKTYGCAVFGIEATIVTVEVNISNGVNFFLVGLPDSIITDNRLKEVKRRFNPLSLGLSI